MVSLGKMPPNECHWTSVINSQHWFRLWLGAVRQQAITWTNVDSDPCRYMASLGPNVLIGAFIWYQMEIYIHLIQNSLAQKILKSLNSIQYTLSINGITYCIQSYGSSLKWKIWSMTSLRITLRPTEQKRKMNILILRIAIVYDILSKYEEFLLAWNTDSFGGL